MRSENSNQSKEFTQYNDSCTTYTNERRRKWRHTYLWTWGISVSTRRYIHTAGTVRVRVPCRREGDPRILTWLGKEWGKHLEERQGQIRQGRYNPKTETLQKNGENEGSTFIIVGYTQNDLLSFCKLLFDIMFYYSVSCKTFIYVVLKINKVFSMRIINNDTTD